MMQSIKSRGRKERLLIKTSKQVSGTAPVLLYSRARDGNTDFHVDAAQENNVWSLLSPLSRTHSNIQAQRRVRVTSISSTVSGINHACPGSVAPPATASSSHSAERGAVGLASEPAGREKQPPQELLTGSIFCFSRTRTRWVVSQSKGLECAGLLTAANEAKQNNNNTLGDKKPVSGLEKYQRREWFGTSAARVRLSQMRNDDRLNRGLY